jgi:hypothetical protein
MATAAIFPTNKSADDASEFLMRPATRSIAKLNVITLVLSAVVHIAPASAAPVTFISSTGSDSNPCTAAQPCATLFAALTNVDAGGQVSCLDPTGWTFSGIGLGKPVTIDCAGVYAVTSAFGAFQIGQAVVIRNLTINGEAGGYPAIWVRGGSSLVLENCVFENIGTGAALDIEPNVPLNLVIRNSRISSGGAAGMILKPATGGSIKATLDRVTITNNGGGGIHADSSNGLISVDVSDSNISENVDNGIVAIAGANQVIVSIKNSVIARNGQAGVEANGANAGVLVATTLLDQNATGATSVVNSGNMFTYGNNDIVGSMGSGFTATAQLR